MTIRTYFCSVWSMSVLFELCIFHFKSIERRQQKKWAKNARKNPQECLTNSSLLVRFAPNAQPFMSLHYISQVVQVAYRTYITFEHERHFNFNLIVVVFRHHLHYAKIYAGKLIKQIIVSSSNTQKCTKLHTHWASNCIADGGRRNDFSTFFQMHTHIAHTDRGVEWFKIKMVVPRFLTFLLGALHQISNLNK